MLFTLKWGVIFNLCVLTMLSPSLFAQPTRNYSVITNASKDSSGKSPAQVPSGAVVQNTALKRLLLELRHKLKFSALSGETILVLSKKPTCLFTPNKTRIEVQALLSDAISLNITQGIATDPELDVMMSAGSPQLGVSAEMTIVNKCDYQFKARFYNVSNQKSSPVKLPFSLRTEFTDTFIEFLVDEAFVTVNEKPGDEGKAVMEITAKCKADQKVLDTVSGRTAYRPLETCTIRYDNGQMTIHLKTSDNAAVSTAPSKK